jgi:hypothetical protein
VTRVVLTNPSGGFSRVHYSVKDFGAPGDGSGALLSSQFGSLAAAQVMYPSVTSLSTSIDSAGIRRAHEMAIAAEPAFSPGTSVYYPAGLYRTTEEIDVGTDVSVWGDGISASKIRPLSDFGLGYYCMRPSALKGQHTTFRDFYMIGPNANAPAKGSTACQMGGLAIPGGNCLADAVEAKYFRQGFEFLADHSSIANCIASACLIGLLFGSDKSQEADQYISQCNFSDNSLACIGIKGSNVMGGCPVFSSHLGFTPHSMLKETSAAALAAPAVTPIVGGATGSPMTAGGTLYYGVAPVMGGAVVDMAEGIKSPVSSGAVIAAGGSAERDELHRLPLDHGEPRRHTRQRVQRRQHHLLDGHWRRADLRGPDSDAG